MAKRRNFRSLFIKIVAVLVIILMVVGGFIVLFK